MAEPKARSWKTWAVKSSEDTLLTTYAPSQHPLTADDTDDRVIVVHPYGVIMARFFGKNANNETFTVTISGWMNHQATGINNGPGPGCILYSGQLILGNSTWNGIPLSDGQWGTAADWFEVDTYAAGVPDYGIDVYDTTDGQGFMLIPTFGFYHLFLEVTDMDGVTGVEAAEMGAMWRGLDADEVSMTKT